MMGQKQSGSSRVSASEQAERDEEVLRAIRELTAYFKGRRTEREARKALKIIKAFVRDREGLDAKDRPPLPGMGKTADRPTSHRRPHRRPSRGKTEDQAEEPPASLEPTVSDDAAELPSSSHH